jgi:hypothetical protein
MNKFLVVSVVVLLALIIIPALAFGPRILKDYKKKRNYANTYAIQNTGTGKDIRVYNAGNDDGTQIILYNHNNWECMTWQLIQLEDNTYLLKNLYTQKTFEPSAVPQSGVGLWQQTLGGSRLQYWEFIEQSNETYLLRLKDTELYVTATSDKNDTPIALMPKQDSDSQLWKLIRQNPVI